MAQRVLGIDLGAYAVKVAEMEASFRATTLKRVHTYPLRRGPEEVLSRSLEALGELKPDPADIIAVGVPGDRVLLRLMPIPFSEPKKVGAVVGHELADDIPWDLEDVLYDYAPLVEPQGMVLAAAVRAAEIRALLEQLGAQGRDPSVLPVSPLSYARIVRLTHPQGAVMVADLGHERTNLCLVVDGRVAMARTVSRGGLQITEAFRQTFQVGIEEAELLKERQAFVAPPGAEQAPPEQQRFGDVTARALAPLSREIRMSAGMFASKLGRPPDRMVLCGGTSLVQGIGEHLAGELGLPVEHLQLAHHDGFGEAQLTAGGGLISALAVGIAMEQGGRRQLDLRQGEFAFKTDRSLFAEKLVFMAVSLVVVLAFAIVNAFVSLYALRKEETALKAQLKKASAMVLGTPVKSPKKIIKRVERGCSKKGAGIPENTAFDILDMLSRLVPGGDTIKLDLSRLDIKPGKTYLKGTADSRSAIDDIIKGLRADDCFGQIDSGKISEVSDGKKQFSLTIKSECF